ncbi:hypothetical protein [Rhizobium alvei]|uniref:Uncharacterized protein n=1 Tax=Rhizobium alvei TaxID=1132659 RepID=A0ABT8YHL2_9HYPH|nr:hypothetical protein [Rhizobium alvei]MDO6962754.1 hypothetical protein [Rhizobium alvei]
MNMLSAMTRVIAKPDCAVRVAANSNLRTYAVRSAAQSRPEQPLLVSMPQSMIEIANAQSAVRVASLLALIAFMSLAVSILALALFVLLLWHARSEAAHRSEPGFEPPVIQRNGLDEKAARLRSLSPDLFTSGLVAPPPSSPRPQH